MAERETPFRQRVGNAARNPGLVLRRLIPRRLQHLLETFWILPLALTILGVAAPFALRLIDESSLAVLFGGEEPEIDIDGARATLSVVAGGVITVTSLVFSLAFVALVMAAATLTMVVLFSHRMTRIMRAEDMVSWLGRAFAEAIRRGPQSITDEMIVTDPAEEDGLEDRLADADSVPATETGYLGAVDYPGLLGWAEENGVCLEILLRENAFVLAGQPVARVTGGHCTAEEIAERITHYVNLTERRVIGETPAYEGNSLSEVAIRALSPGINDPATARSCANRLYQGLVTLAALPERPRALKGEDGVPRLLRARQGIPEFLENDVAPIVEAARDRMTLRHLRELNETLAGIARRPKECAAIEKLARLIADREIPAERYLGDVASEPPPTASGGGNGGAGD